MNKLKILFVSILITAAVLTSTGETGEGEDVSRLRADLQSLVTELRYVRTQFNDEREQLEAEIRETQLGAEAVRKKLDEVRLRNRDSSQKISKLTENIEKRQVKLKADRRALERVCERMKEFSGQQFVAVGEGIPFRTEARRERLSDIGSGTDLVWFNDYLAYELRLSRTGGTFREDMPVGEGRIKPARIVRTGHLLMAYITEDGEDAGFWAGKRDGEDIWERELSGRQLKEVRDAVDILERRKVPRRLEMTVPLAAEQSSNFSEAAEGGSQ